MEKEDKAGSDPSEELKRLALALGLTGFNYPLNLKIPGNDEFQRQVSPELAKEFYFRLSREAEYSLTYLSQIKKLMDLCMSSIVGMPSNGASHEAKPVNNVQEVQESLRQESSFRDALLVPKTQRENHITFPPKQSYVAPYIPSSAEPIRSSSPSAYQEFSVLTYNILANAFVSPERYSYVQNATFILDPELRRARILSLIKELSPTVLCLQEVEKETFDFFERSFSGQYQGLYGSARHKKDGVAIFFKTSVFRYISIKTIYLDRLVSTSISTPKVGLALHLALHSDPSITLVVTTVHLSGDPTLPMVPLEEISAFLNEVNRLFGDVALILSGDFNSDPGSAVCTLVKKSVPLEHYTQPYPLVSSYAAANQGREPEVTFCTDRSKRCVDYIFYRNDRLAVQSVLPTPTLMEIVSNGFLPNVYHPSDHIPLMSTFKFVPIKQVVEDSQSEIWADVDDASDDELAEMKRAVSQ